VEEDVQLTVSRQADRLLVTWRGDIDMANVTAMEQKTLGSVRNSDSMVFVDLSGVTYLDSAGIRCLLTMRRLLEDRQQHLSLILPESSILNRALQIGGIPAVIQVHRSLEASEA
jgi:anti-anti-sigma factor